MTREEYKAAARAHSKAWHEAAKQALKTRKPMDLSNVPPMPVVPEGLFPPSKNSEIAKGFLEWSQQRIERTKQLAEQIKQTRERAEQSDAHMEQLTANMRKVTAELHQSVSKLNPPPRPNDDKK